MKNPAAVMLGSIKSDKKAIASKKNGQKGGYWKQARNINKKPQGLNKLYE